MDCPTPGVHHQLPQPAQTHVNRVSDAIQLSHPLSSPSPAFNLSQHQGLFLMSQFFASGGQSIGVSASASVLPVNIQDWFPLGLTGWISLQSSGLSRVFSNTIVQKHWCFSAQLSLSWWSKSQIHTWLLEFFLCRFVNPLSYFASEMGEEIKEIGLFFFNLCCYNSTWYLLFNLKFFFLKQDKNFSQEREAKLSISSCV